MEFRRHYDPESLTEWKRVRELFVTHHTPTVCGIFNVSPDGARELLLRYYNPGVKPKITHLEVLKATKNWHLSTRLMQQGMKEGWLAFGDNKVIIKTEDGKPDLVYNVLEHPGTFCCHCKQRLQDDNTGKIPRDHIQSLHVGVPSPDPQNPSGWKVNNYYDCDRVGDFTGDESESWLAKIAKRIGVRG